MSGRVHQAYVVETIGEIGDCDCARMGDVAVVPSSPSPVDALAEALKAKAREIADAADDVASELRRRANDLRREVKNALPAPPDPIPPALDVAGPSGWGSYVGPSVLVLAALGAAGFLVMRGKHARSRRSRSA